MDNEEGISHNNKGDLTIPEWMPQEIDRLGSRTKWNDATPVTSQAILQGAVQWKGKEHQLNLKESTLLFQVRELVQGKPPLPIFKKSLQHHFL